MATLYEFAITQYTKATDGGRKGDTSAEPSRKSPAKKGDKTTSLFGGSKGGVEHNRKMRAINPLLNKATHGYWEKGMRLGRAGAGLIKVDAQTGAFAGLSGTSITIIISLIITTILKIHNQQREHAKSLNTNNFKMLENGVGSIMNDYDISVNLWDSRATYNENK